MPSSSLKLSNLQILRGAAILLVIAYHLFRAEEKFLPEGRVLSSALAVGSAGVDLFFVISGFVIAWTTLFDGRPPVSRGSFLARRFFRIYPIYWFYSALALAVFVVRPGWVNASQGNSFSWMATIFLAPAERLPILMVGWSLIFEVYFYVVFAIFLPLTRRFLLPFLGVWLFALAGAHFFAAPKTPLQQLMLSPMAAEFIAGCTAAYLARMTTRPLLGLLSVIGGLLLFFAAVLNSEFHQEIGLTWTRVFAFGIPSFFIVFGAATIELHGGSWRARLLSRIGDASYSTYLTHVLVLAALGRLAAAAFANPALRSIVLVSMLLAVLLAGELSYRIIEQRLLRWSKGVRRITPATSVPGTARSPSAPQYR